MLKKERQRAWAQTAIDASDMNVPLNIRKKTTTPRSGGERKPVYTTESTITWAKVEDRGGREVWISEGKTAIADYYITIYFRDDLTADDQLLMNGRILRILTPPQNMRQRNNLMTFHAKDIGKDNG